MPQERIHATELARLLNAARQPVYVLDDELCIVFFNRACRQWLGAAAEDLLGRRCAYHSRSDLSGPDAVAAGLCPPPAALAGQELTATVALAPPEGPTRYRRAKFIPLAAGPEDVLALVAIVAGEDLPQAVVETAPLPGQDAAAVELHEQVRRFRRQAAARYRADRLVGTSAAARRARRQVEVAAGSRCSVLVVGQPGSGRQHVAAAIHYGSDPASAGSLVPLDCAVLGAELIRSTLLALATGNPLGESSARSTLLLGEVDRLPADVQAELAGILVGRPFALRLIATAEQPLGELVRRARFREDLADLLSTITIELPPLAERREDLPLLAQMFLEEINAHGTKQIGGFAAEALDRLDAHNWPGNLDELAIVVAQAHQRAGGAEIGVADLPERLHLAAGAAAYPRRTEETIVLPEFLGRMERELVRRALAQAKGNKAKAARLLGLTRARLYRRMVQLGLVKGEGGGSVLPPTRAEGGRRKAEGGGGGSSLPPNGPP
jgi:transcriptional regulator with PAS, ATPase and Fis domain